MNRKALLAAAAAAALAAASTAQADDQSSEPHKQPQQSRPQLQHPAGQHSAQQGQHRQDWAGQPGQVSGQHPGGQPPKGSPPKGQAQGWRGAQGQGQGSHGSQWQGRPGGRPGQGETWGQGQGHGQTWGQGQDRGQAWGQDRGQDRGQSWGQRPGGGEHAAQTGHWNVQTERHFDRRANPEQWNETRRDWRGEHSGWNNEAPWRRDHDWWRRRREFHDYAGVRIGFWFAPGYGYYRVPESYWERQWGPGDYLPAFMWEYQVADWDDYGLPPPPYGCAWVWINGGVALIDLSDGYVLEVEYGLW